MRIGIVGWGIEGQSAYRYYGPDHQYLIVNEERPVNLPSANNFQVQFLDSTRQPGITGNVEDLSYLEGIDECDRIVYSVTAYKNLRKQFGDDLHFWNKAETVLKIFFENVSTKNLIGITGTKGKGTTSSLLHQMLQASGKKTWLAGNIGVSVLDVLPKIQPDDWVVLELSSFQLHEFPYSPPLGICLMVVPEHLDWHANMDEYVQAKSNLFAHQTPQDIAIYFADNDYSRQIASYSKGKKIPYYKQPGASLRQDGMIVINDTEVAHKSEAKLLGEHNLQNICAALTAFWQVGQDAAAARRVINSFTGLEHRLEFVRELDGVKYYNDSFGTTPETSIVAMKSFSEPKIMILGGSDKGIPFDRLADTVATANVRHAIVIGDTAPQIIKLLNERGFKNVTEGLNHMTEIVAAAKKLAQPGDVVLLSAGCASFGLFKDYKDRGNQFKQSVNELG